VHFLDFLDWRIAKRWEVHVILEILETPDLQPLSGLKDWFAAHARFHAHYPPTKSHWIDEVGRWLAQMPCDTRGLAELSGAFKNYQRVEKPEIPLAWIPRGGSRFTRRGSEGDVLLGYFLRMFSDLEDALRSGKRSLDVPVELFQNSESTMITGDLLHALVESRQLRLTELP
jgi:hypothetical protein